MGAYPVYLILSAAAAFSFELIVAVNLVYQAQTVGLTPLQLVLVGTLLEIVCFIGEVPTGIVADLYSRRLSVIIGTALIGAGFLIEGALPFFAAVLAAQVVWGLGATFVSGAEAAWIADEVGEARAGPAFMRAAQVGQIAALVAIPISVALASIQLNLPIVVGAGLYLALALFLVVAMPERGFRPAPPEERATWRAMGDTLRSGLGLVRRQPRLLPILLTSLFYGMTTEGVDRLSTPHLLDNFTFPVIGELQPVAWFGILSAGGMLLSIPATELVRRRLDLADGRAVARMLFATYGLWLAGIVGFALAGGFWPAFVCLLGASLCRTVSGPLYRAWLNGAITDSRVRATLMSVGGQANALGQIAGGPILGVVATVASLRAALLMAALAFAPGMLLLAGAARPDARPPIAGDSPLVERADAAEAIASED
jgi:DHA3 family tetracycline resistance protein-like MFS transporter